MSLFKTYGPSEALKDMVALYWRSKSEFSDSLIQEMNTPTMQALTFNMRGWHEEILFERQSQVLDKNCYVIGQPLSKRISISNPLGIDILGVKFTPLGLYLLTGIDMQHISDRIIEASDLWGDEISLLYEQLAGNKNIEDQIVLIETFLIKKRKIQQWDVRLQKLNQALNLLDQDRVFSVSRLRDECYVTKKTFERYFLNFLGVSPKQYSNIHRFNEVLDCLNTSCQDPHWHEMIVRFGYYDQSHFIREFRRFANMTPGEYFANVVNNQSMRSESSLLQII